ncbi:ABC transporter ATP-binding protein [Paenibacillus donghaensis]|uniref:Sulfonate ABC transporter ATP-binding protein n=1 Tax=Paenibacillus donghaensis TaxID=414771 RepID=A0A2Z2KLF5_9BACL|nr:ABC transporter ATP-binding protein [Paenibacillus donghaensis]ASA24223.1 sulfonate ABC transporter ATP-binding protein [Paenibacillus donghaensis]
MGAALLSIARLNKQFETAAGPVHALHNVDLQVQEGELITVIGPSGCGKSTLLRIIAGLDLGYTGSVTLEGAEIGGPGVDKGFIFQEHRLFPWLTVEKNIAADLPLGKPEIRRKVDELISLVKLNGFEKSYPRELSGGMAQRVSIARALLRNPKVLLLDEPFGALDAFTRAHMQSVLLDIWRANRTTMIFVTHDIDEAVFLGSRVVVLEPRPGKIRSIVPIDLPYPRKKSNISFQELRLKVMNVFEKVDELELTDGAGI